MSSYRYVLILLLGTTRAATGAGAQSATFRSIPLCVSAVSLYYCTYFSSYYCTPIYMSSYIYVLILLLGTTRAATGAGAQSATFRSTRCSPTRCLSVCPHTTTMCVLNYYYMCPHTTTIYLSSYYYLDGAQQGAYRSRAPRERASP